ncbi:hypothetical protein PRIPAC_75297 [Pristionchus pacificus]|uniref:Uncharacterized protein n=1 Tax=Pristionchus pacificus TaxID=54126 RepID=A0A2A6BF92_PRIPA|nr:hypothetical protein PRIPAC_75297 [Pristionchus pacificus]|eukprot:PDM64523.1 hypothetical protein PRIPAC_52779 [Pristionchus pacificus]
MTLSKLHICHSQDVQATSTLKASVAARCFDKISVSIICHHGGSGAHLLYSEGRSSRTVASARSIFSWEKATSQNRLRRPGPARRIVYKFSLSSIAVDDPTTECATVRLMGNSRRINCYACDDRWTDWQRQRRHRRKEGIGGLYADRGRTDLKDDINGRIPGTLPLLTRSLR